VPGIAIRGHPVQVLAGKGGFGLSFMLKSAATLRRSGLFRILLIIEIMITDSWDCSSLLTREFDGFVKSAVVNRVTATTVFHIDLSELPVPTDLFVKIFGVCTGA
jgi:hypothetical protein